MAGALSSLEASIAAAIAASGEANTAIKTAKLSAALLPAKLKEARRDAAIEAQQAKKKAAAAQGKEPPSGTIPDELQQPTIPNVQRSEIASGALGFAGQAAASLPQPGGPQPAAQGGASTPGQPPAPLGQTTVRSDPLGQVAAGAGGRAGAAIGIPLALARLFSGNPNLATLARNVRDPAAVASEAQRFQTALDEARLTKNAEPLKAELQRIQKGTDPATAAEIFSVGQTMDRMAQVERQRGVPARADSLQEEFGMGRSEAVRRAKLEAEGRYQEASEGLGNPLSAQAERSRIRANNAAYDLSRARLAGVQMDNAEKARQANLTPLSARYLPLVPRFESESGEAGSLPSAKDLTDKDGNLRLDRGQDALRLQVANFDRGILTLYNVKDPRTQGFQALLKGEEKNTAFVGLGELGSFMARNVNSRGEYSPAAIKALEELNLGEVHDDQFVWAHELGDRGYTHPNRWMSMGLENFLLDAVPPSTDRGEPAGMGPSRTIEQPTGPAQIPSEAVRKTPEKLSVGPKTAGEAFGGTAQSVIDFLRGRQQQFQERARRLGGG